ncbi:caspase family protein [Mesorhizobium sp. KR9-304]|uniref:caspase family protein n=1 Tax=Mesorhizobium sp. KR9-304 TaxID=3156614 RepID=UPI0032B55158
MLYLWVLLFGMFSAAYPAAAADESCTAGWPEPAFTLHMARRSDKAVVGEPMTFEWRVTEKAPRGPAAFEVPAYLVFLAPEATRFEGRGFYALTPGARGPFEMKFGQNRVRAIVPLMTRFAQLTGKIDFLAYRAGGMEIEWAIVQADPCGERISRFVGKRIVDVLPGTPKLVVRDEFAVVTADAEIVPNQGAFLARIYGRFVEVSNRTTGEVVLQTTGREPVFSPTGRFLSVSTDEAQISDVFDLLAERRVGRFQGVGMYWSHADSFLYLDQEWGGGMQVVRMLHGRRHAVEEAPKIALLTGFKEDDTPEPDNPIHAGLDPKSEDIDPGEGAGSFTQGSEVWQMQISLEGGVAAFMAGLSDGESIVLDEEAAGVVIDLGMKSPMIATTRSDELDTILRSDFGLQEPRVVGWNAHDLRKTYDYWDTEVFRKLRDPDDVPEQATQATTAEEDDDDGFIEFSKEPTQSTRTNIVVAASEHQASGTQVRSAISLIAPDSSLADSVSDPLGFRLGVGVRTLRSGIDEADLSAISAKLAGLYDSRVAKFEVWPEDEPLTYNTEPFPQPSPEIFPDEPVFIDLNLEGRDTWAWSSGGKNYWLTQTIESGRLGHGFSFTLLGEDSGDLRHADLLAAPGAGAEALYEDGPIGLIQRGDLRGNLGSGFSDPTIVSVVDNRYLLVATRPVVRLVVFDLKTWAPVCAVPEPYNQAAIERLALTNGYKHLVQLNRGGAVEVYSCKDGTRVLSGIFADGELVVMDKDGYFDGSEDAAAYVQLKIPGIPGRQLLSQFGSRLREPGLAKSVLQDSWRPSKPEMVFPPTVSVSETGSGGGLRVVVRGPRGLRSLQIFAGGRRVEHVDLSGTEWAMDFAADRHSTEGILTLVATDADGITSAPLELMRDPASSKPAGRLYGLTVGVDKYPNMTGADLKYAAADARRIAGIVGASRRYESVEMATLVDGQVTPETLRGNLRKIIGGATVDDTILLSFAGHGLVSAAGGLRLALPETDLGDIERTTFDFDEIGAVVSTAKARVIVLLDVCHAGASGRASIASSDDVVRQFSTQSGSGIVLLSASKGRQLSQESAAVGGGLFSVAFERALDVDRSVTDVDGNGRISLVELYRTVKATVATETAGSQTPWLARNQVFGDFDLF